LVRHGQVSGYEQFSAYDHTDVDMTEIGVIQMEHLAERLRLANIKAI
jgi:broad specificity phosphatase PhoE